MAAPDLPERWLTDTEPSPRSAYFTRANANEVGPEPFTPLGWTLGWELGCMPGVADGFVDFAVIRRDEFALDPPEVFANVGGYFYNPLSMTRLMGVRMPGASVEDMDFAYFGDHPGVPPYEPHPGDEDAAQSALLAEKMTWAMTTPSYPEMDEAARMAERVRRARPDLSAVSDAELVAYARSIPPAIHEAWGPYCVVCLAGSLGPGAVQAVCAAAERPDAAVSLLAGLGGVESANTSHLVWQVARLVHDSPSLMAAFDAAGHDGLGELRGRIGELDDPAAAQFLAAFDDLLDRYGHRGPNEWDLGAPSWDTDPRLPLGMIERLRFQSDDRDPAAALERAATERAAVTAEISAAIADQPELQATLQAGLHSAGVFLPTRERGKDAVIKLIHETKLAMMELGRRLHERDELERPEHVFMALERELDTLLTDPLSLRTSLAERAAVLAELALREPPYIVGRGDVPPLAQWPLRGSGPTTAVAVGDVLQGAGGAPGVATGFARIVLQPSDPGELGPDDIMIAPTTDPSWTPLFLSVGAVVCNVGAVASHASIVCRELGVPCAVSVHDATSRIPDGATITVNGSTGTVTIDALP